MHRLVFCIVPFLILIACSGHDKRENSPNAFDLGQIPQLELEQEFTISKFNGVDFFGYVSNVVPGSGETILVSDPTTRKIHLFSYGGAYLGFLGGHGAGPGEFRRISHMALLASDTVQVVDITSARITLFAYSGTEWVVSSTFKPPMGSDIHPGLEMFSFRQFYPWDEGYVAALESTISSFDSDNFIKECFRALDKDFKPIPAASPLCHNKLELLVREYSDASAHTVSAMPIPEGYQTLSTVTGAGLIVSTWTQKPVVTIQNIYGEKRSEFEYDSAYIPISFDLRTSLSQKAVPSEESSNIQREEVINAIPPHKGFAEQMLVDDKNQIWILRRSQTDDLVWHIHSIEGNLLGWADHPGGTFTHITNKRVYVAHNSDDQEPAFSVFKVTTENP